MSKRIYELPDSGTIDPSQSFPVEKTDGSGSTGKQTIGRILDKAQQTAGLKPWVSRIYMEGECALVNGEVRQFAPIGSNGSEFFPEEWILVGKKPSQYGYPDYNPSETYNTNDRITFANRLWRQINALSCSGITPLQQPLGSSYWAEVSISEDRFGRDYDLALSDDGYEVVGLKGDVVLKELNGEKGLYQAEFAGHPGQSFLSTDFLSELHAGYWKPIQAGMVRSFQVDFDPGVVFGAPSGGELGDFTRTTKILNPIQGFAYYCLSAVLIRLDTPDMGSNGGPLSIQVVSGEAQENKWQRAASFASSDIAFTRRYIEIEENSTSTDQTFDSILGETPLLLKTKTTGGDYSEGAYRIVGTYILIKVD